MKTLLFELSALVLLALALNGCRNSEGATPQPTKVVIQPVRAATENQSLAYSGTIQESELTALSFPVVGNISRVLVSEGDVVRRGQLLAELNNATYRNTYEIVKAALRQAEDAYGRVKPMHQNGNVADVKFVEVETALHSARAAAEVARKNMADCRLYSPVDGIVGKRSMEQGMTAMPNLSSIDIVRIDRVFARISVPENEIASILKNQKATVRIAALGDVTMEGTVLEIGVLADPLVHTYKVRIAIDNRNLRIKPGMICTVTLSPQEDHPRLVVPAQAVLVDETGKNFLYVANQNRAQRRNVTTGELCLGGIEITAGIDTTDLVVTSGQHNLADNSVIEIVGRSVQQEGLRQQ